MKSVDEGRPIRLPFPMTKFTIITFEFGRPDFNGVHSKRRNGFRWGSSGEMGRFSLYTVLGILSFASQGILERNFSGCQKKFFRSYFINVCFDTKGILFRVKYGYGAPENENTPHFREIPSVAPEVFHCVRVGGRTVISSTYDLPGDLLSYSDPLSLFSSTSSAISNVLNLSLSSLCK